MRAVTVEAGKSRPSRPTTQMLPRRKICKGTEGLGNAVLPGTGLARFRAREPGLYRLTGRRSGAVVRPEARRDSRSARLPGGPARDRVLFFSQYEELFRRSGRMKAVEALVMRVADTDGPVLIQGEPGTGKELVAQAIHYLSGRSGKPWQRVNCASLPGDLLESEIFGFEGEAPADTPIRQSGKLDLADGGTLLLDEIADIPPVLHARIVHLVRDGQFFRAGGHELISTGVRLLATTVRDLKAMAVLGVVTIVVPPLRERREE